MLLRLPAVGGNLDPLTLLIFRKIVMFILLAFVTCVNKCYMRYAIFHAICGRNMPSEC